jgi:hypothetical protein
MQEIMQFVSSSIASGIVGNVAYDGLKVILGSSFSKLSDYLSNNQKVKFECALEMLLEDETLVKKIEYLMEGKTIDDSFKRLENSEIEADLGKGAKVINSFKDNINSPIKIR